MPLADVWVQMSREELFVVSDNKEIMQRTKAMKKFAGLFILLAGILWGSLGWFVRKLNEAGLYSMDIVFIRALVTCIFMGVFILFYDRKMFRIRWKDIWCFLGTGLCSIVFFNFCYFQAIALTSLSVAAVLLYTAPSFVMIMSFFLFHEKFNAKKIISLVMTFLGCMLVTGILSEKTAVTGMGFFMGLGAGFGYALYSVFGKFAIQRGYHSFTITFYTFTFATVGSLLFVDMPKIYTALTLDAGRIGLSLLLGIAGTVVPYLTYTLGLKYVENGKASIIASVEPVTATLLGAVLYREKLTLSGVLGVIIVLAALTICNLPEKQKKA